MNEHRTASNSRTDLAPPRSRGVRSNLQAYRRVVGALSAAGHRCSSMDEMLQNRETATGDQLANLNRDIAIQAAELAALSLPKGHQGGQHD